MFNIWKVLETKISTSENDSILGINTAIPPHFPGLQSFSNDIKQLPDNNFNLIISDSILNGLYVTDSHFARINKRLEHNGYYIMSEPVTGAEDAYLNSLLARLRPDHIRFYRTEEIIKSCSKYLELCEFIRFTEKLTIKNIVKNQEERATAEYYLEDIPDFISEKIEPCFSGNDLSVNISIGLFIWQKVGNHE